jgi:hypothetical protein
MYKPFGAWRCICLILLLVQTSLASAEKAEDEHSPSQDKNMLLAKSIDQIALDLSHPASSLITIRNDFQRRIYQGNLPEADDQTSGRYMLRPSWPIRLNNGRNLLLRAKIPLNSDQPFYQVRFFYEEYSEWMIRQLADTLPRDRQFTDGHDHLDDVEFDITYGGVNDNGKISMFGVKIVTPTSDDFTAARKQLLLGPEVMLGKVADWGTIGATATHVTYVAGDDDFPTNMTALEMFFAYGLGNGWQVISKPKLEYDWEAASGNKFFLPIGGGVAKTTRLGRTPIRMELEIYHYIESPEAFGPEWLFTFSITPVVGGR